MKIGDKVKVLTVQGTVSEDEENHWEIVGLDPEGGRKCLIRNDFDQQRAKAKGRNAAPQVWHTSLLALAE